MNETIIVSIICNTYNHEKYIKDALDGFIMQKTTFPFEVLIHDDCSTDHTADIIKQYEKQYPELIRPIYQPENQYSKGISIGKEYQFPRVRGKYVAFCEGDDYWTDPNKLQKQYEIMEQNPNVDICSHDFTCINAHTGSVRAIKSRKDHTCIIPAKEVIAGGGSYFGTATLFFRSSLLYNEPEFRKMMRYDYTLQVSGSLRGGALYIAENMSVYRALVTNSWVDRMKKSPVKRAEHKKKYLKMLIQMNKDTKWAFFLPILGQFIENTKEYIAIRMGISK